MGQTTNTASPVLPQSPTPPEFDDKPPGRLARYDRDWYFVAN